MAGWADRGWGVNIRDGAGGLGGANRIYPVRRSGQRNALRFRRRR